LIGVSVAALEVRIVVVGVLVDEDDVGIDDDGTRACRFRVEVLNTFDVFNGVRPVGTIGNGIENGEEMVIFGGVDI
jgi:hypothetical protein